MSSAKALPSGSNVNLELEEIKRRLTRTETILDHYTKLVCAALPHAVPAVYFRGKVELTSDDCGPANDAIRKSMSSTDTLDAIDEYGLQDIYYAGAKKNEIVPFSNERVCVYPRAALDDEQSLRAKNIYMLVAPAPVLCGDKYIQPMILELGAVPNLVSARCSFYPLVTPRAPQCLNVNAVRHALMVCKSAIFAFYRCPFRQYVEAALLAYFIGSGRSDVFLLMDSAFGQEFSSTEIDEEAVNILHVGQQTRYADVERRMETCRLVLELKKAVQRTNPAGRVVDTRSFDTCFSATKNARDLDHADDLTMMIAEEPSPHSFKGALLADADKPRTSISFAGRQCILKDIEAFQYKTDNAQLAIYAYKMGLYSSSTTSEHHKELLGLVTRVVAIASIFNLNVAGKRGSTHHLKDMGSLLELLLCLIPSDLQEQFAVKDYLKKLSVV